MFLDQSLGPLTLYFLEEKIYSFGILHQQSRGLLRSFQTIHLVSLLDNVLLREIILFLDQSFVPCTICFLKGKIYSFGDLHLAKPRTPQKFQTLHLVSILDTVLPREIILYLDQLLGPITIYFLKGNKYCFGDLHQQSHGLPRSFQTIHLGYLLSNFLIREITLFRPVGWSP